jgi:hypothetical protein
LESEGSPERRRNPIKVKIAPKRIVSSKAMITKAGMDTTGLPPVISGGGSHRGVIAAALAESCG